MSAKLNSPIKLPSGLEFSNRLVKAAMAENMAEDSDPGDKYITAYNAWSSGGWGGLLTGNVEVSTVYRENNNTIALKPTMTSATRDKWTRWAMASQQNGTPTIVQLVHPGRQSPGGAGSRGFFAKSIAPSAIPLRLGNGILERLMSKVVFGTPRAMTLEEVEEVIDQFVATAKLCYESGFKGVELHAAHGYLLSQFMSSAMNTRTDAYGGTLEKRTRIVIDIIRGIRKVVPASFTIGLKLNSADVAGKENLEESLEQIGIIEREQIDFLEISGGTYENPRMAEGDESEAPARTSKREAFFLEYAQAVRARYPNIILMVTGGFRTRTGMIEALESNSCDLIGLARPAAAMPDFPKRLILNEQVKDEDAALPLTKVKGGWLIRQIPIKVLGTGVDSMYYQGQIHQMAIGKTPEPPPKA